MDAHLLKKKLEREQKARKQAEQLLETKAFELYQANESLKELNANLEEEIEARTTQLRESEARYRNLVQQASDIIFNVDEEGYFTFINSIGIRKFGFEEKDIIGKRYVDLIPEDYKELVFEYYTNFKESDKEEDYYVFPILGKDGNHYWFGQNVKKIKAEDGTLNFSAVARDITIRKKAEEALEKAKQALIKSEIKYRSIMENMELGLLEVDLDGYIIKAYDQFNQMTGYEGDELIGKHAIKTLAAPGFESIVKQQDNNRLDGKTGVYELKVRKKDGSEIWVLISGAPFYNEKEEIIGTLGIHYDITERKHLQENLEKAKQQAVKAQKAEKQFLANVSHEIRTPLNAIIGMSHLLQDTDLSDIQSEYLDILSSSAAILKTLISDILDISKIDAGTLDIQLKAFNLKETVEKLIHIFSTRALEKNILFQSSIDTGISHKIISDQQIFSQIILNLLSNAEKFTQEGTVEVLVTLENEDTTNYDLLFEVKDSGIGISDKEIKLIFEQFKQANAEIRRRYGGTGLGLTISKRMVDLLGGELKVDSKLNEGSNFFFRLSVEKGGPIREKSSQQKISNIKFDQREYNALVVEDNRLNLTYITTLLKKWKINYAVAMNGEEALSLFESRWFDIVFMDIQMPIMDGLEATRIIRQMEGDKKDVPIVALTASSFLSKKRMALQTGMTDFISKPFTPDQLEEVLVKYLKKEKGVKQTSDKYFFDPFLDQNYLDQMYGNDLNYAYDMFVTFLSIIDGEWTLLEAFVSERDKEKIKKQLHKVKPTFAMVGITSITQQMENLEKKVSDMTISEISSSVKELRQKMEEALPYVEKEADRMKAII